MWFWFVILSLRRLFWMIYVYIAYLLNLKWIWAVCAWVHVCDANTVAPRHKVALVFLATKLITNTKRMNSNVFGQMSVHILHLVLQNLKTLGYLKSVLLCQRMKGITLVSQFIWGKSVAFKRITKWLSYWSTPEVTRLQHMTPALVFIV